MPRPYYLALNESEHFIHTIFYRLVMDERKSINAILNRFNARLWTYASLWVRASSAWRASLSLVFGSAHASIQFSSVTECTWYRNFFLMQTLGTRITLLTKRGWIRLEMRSGMDWKIMTENLDGNRRFPMRELDKCISSDFLLYSRSMHKINLYA